MLALACYSLAAQAVSLSAVGSELAPSCDAQGTGLERSVPAQAPEPAGLGGAALAGNGGNLLYASVNDGGVPETIYFVQQSTGKALALGASGFNGPLDLASDWRLDSFRIWAPDYDTNQLIRIDPRTGAGTAVGPFGSAATMESLAFDVTTDRMYGSDVFDLLYEIDPDTGAALAIGPIHFSGVFGLAFDANGTLFGVSGQSLITIDTASGSGTLVGQVFQPAITDIAFRPSDGVLFACDTPTDSIYTLDPGSGQGQLVGPYGAGINYMVGLAFSPTFVDVDLTPGLLQAVANGQGMVGASVGGFASIQSGGANLGAALFDTTPGGPNAGGAAPELLVGQGHALILQDGAHPGQVGGAFLVPQPAQTGGRLSLLFTGRAEPLSLDLIGLGEHPARVRLLDADGRTRSFSVPAGWTSPACSGTLDLASLAPQPGFSAAATGDEDPGFRPRAVVGLEVTFSGPAALDEVRFFSDQ